MDIGKIVDMALQYLGKFEDNEDGEVVDSDETEEYVEDF